MLVVVLPPVLDDYHHLLFLVCDDMGDGLEAFPVKADCEDVVTVFRPIGCSHPRCVNIPIQLYWDDTHGHSYPPLSFIFRLEPEILG